jgi:hypothetical protein
MLCRLSTCGSKSPAAIPRPTKDDNEAGGVAVSEGSAPGKVIMVIDDVTLCDRVGVTFTWLKGEVANARQISGVRLRSLKRRAKAGCFTDREDRAPAGAADVCEVILSTLSVRRARECGACWLGSRLWQELGLDEFSSVLLHDRRGSVEWVKVVENS